MALPQEDEDRFEEVDDPSDFLPAADDVEGDTIMEIRPNPLDAPPSELACLHFSAIGVHPLPLRARRLSCSP